MASATPGFPPSLCSGCSPLDIQHKPSHPPVIRCLERKFLVKTIRQARFTLNHANGPAQKENEQPYTASAVDGSGQTSTPGMTCRQKKSSDLSFHWLLQRTGGARRHEPHVAAVTPSRGGTGDVLSSALSESLGARSVVDPGHVTQPRGSLSSLSAFSPSRGSTLSKSQLRLM